MKVVHNLYISVESVCTSDYLCKGCTVDTYPIANGPEQRVHQLVRIRLLQHMCSEPGGFTLNLRFYRVSQMLFNLIYSFFANLFSGVYSVKIALTSF